MWKVKLDDRLWLAKDGTTMKESDAWLIPDMSTVQAELTKARRFVPYKDAMVIADFDQPKT